MILFFLHQDGKTENYLLCRNFAFRLCVQTWDWESPFFQRLKNVAGKLWLPLNSSSHHPVYIIANRRLCRNWKDKFGCKVFLKYFPSLREWEKSMVVIKIYCNHASVFYVSQKQKSKWKESKRIFQNCWKSLLSLMPWLLF